MSLSIGTRIERWNPDLDFLHAWENVSSKISSKAQVELIQYARVKMGQNISFLFRLSLQKTNTIDEFLNEFFSKHQSRLC